MGGRKKKMEGERGRHTDEAAMEHPEEVRTVAINRPLVGITYINESAIQILSHRKSLYFPFSLNSEDCSCSC